MSPGNRRYAIKNLVMSVKVKRISEKEFAAGGAGNKTRKPVENMGNVLVSCHGYAGDAHQIQNMLPYYEHHGHSLVILSPEDSKIREMGPHICLFGGRRAYIGPLSLERQRIHLEMLLEHPFEWFLANDSDSVCLSPNLPKYLFERGDVLWSNVVSDEMHPRAADYKWPRLASQPPYVMSRRVVERLIQASYKVKPDRTTCFIDWAMQVWATQAGIPLLNFPAGEGVSCPSSDEHSASHMENCIRNGAIFAHSIKKPDVLARMVSARRAYNRSQGRGMTL